MEVILLEKQRNLGNLGDKIAVKPGYARNYLIPHGKAVRATKENIVQFEARRAELEKLQADHLSKAQARADKLAELIVTITANAGDDGKLFGSVGTKDIAEAVTTAGIAIEKHEVLLPNGTLRQLGEYEVQIQLHSDLVSVVKLAIVSDK